MEFDTATRKSLNSEMPWSMSNAFQAPYHTSDQSSFAYVSARDRWPVILVSTIIVSFLDAPCKTDTYRQEPLTMYIVRL